MLSPRDLSDLIETDRRDVLSVSLDVDPTRPEHQAIHPAYHIWLRNALRELADGRSRESRRETERLVEQVLAHVDGRRPQGRGLALFAAADLWREYVLPFPVPNRVSYGRPDLVPLLWAMDEYDPYAILVVDREHARLIVAYLGETSVLGDEELDLDTADWRFKAGRQASHAKGLGVAAGRGSQRDTFAARVEDHVRRFWHGAAEAAARWMADLQVDRLIIGGPEEAASAVRDLLPSPARERVVALVPLPSHAGLAEIRDRTLPVALAEEHRREGALVSAVLDGAAARAEGVAGRVPTLEALMREQVQTLVVDRDLSGEVWRCGRCGYVSGAKTTVCPSCGDAVEAIPLPQVLPLLARRSGARIELVGAPAAEALRPHEGIGALLRYVPQTTGPSGAAATGAG